MTQAFSQRRKTIANTLKNSVSVGQLEAQGSIQSYVQKPCPLNNMLLWHNLLVLKISIGYISKSLSTDLAGV